MKIIAVYSLKTYEIRNKVCRQIVKFLNTTTLLQTQSTLLENITGLIFIVNVSQCSLPVANIPSEYRM